MTDYTAACEHETQRLTRRTFSNNTVHFVAQCAVCGKHVRTVVRSDPWVQQHDDPIPEFDDGLVQRYWDQRRIAADARRADYIAERREAYQDYLASPQWWQRRQMRLRVDEGLCQARLPGCTTRATEVHHLTYQHIGNEPLFDLRSVCSECHREITRMDRGGLCDGEAA